MTLTERNFRVGLSFGHQTHFVFSRPNEMPMIVTRICIFLLHGSTLPACGTQRNLQNPNTIGRTQNPTRWGHWPQTHLGFSGIKSHTDLRMANLSLSYSLLISFLPLNDRTFSRSFCVVDWDPLTLYFN